MSASRCAEIRERLLPPLSDTRDLAAMLERAMRELDLVYQGGLRTPEMVALLKECGML